MTEEAVQNSLFSVQTPETEDPPLSLPPAVIDLRVLHHPDPDYAIMTILGHLQESEWRILRYDCDLEQHYAHVQAKRFDLPRFGVKELAISLRDLITDEQDARRCTLLAETSRVRVSVNWEEGAQYVTLTGDDRGY